MQFSELKKINNYWMAKLLVFKHCKNARYDSNCCEYTYQFLCVIC